MRYAVAATGAVPVRRKADHRSEMVNQLLFGEVVKVVNQKGDQWIKLQSLYDGYEGWCQAAMLRYWDKTGGSETANAVVTDLFGKVRLDDGAVITVPAGASLYIQSGKKGRLADAGYRYHGNSAMMSGQQPSLSLLQKLVLPWQNAPYLWGGRTPMGVDCSGLVQVIFKQMGIVLPRDAWQQAEKGKAIRQFNKAKAGDLAFFERGGKIIHVGILLPEEQIIHASGKVRIDRLTKKGIVNAETGQLMVHLKKIQRLY